MIRNLERLADIGERCLRQEMDKAVGDLDGSAEVLMHFQDAEKTPSRLADCEIMFGLVLGSARRYSSCKSRMIETGLDVEKYDAHVANSIRGLKGNVVYWYMTNLHKEEGIKHIVATYMHLIK